MYYSMRNFVSSLPPFKLASYLISHYYYMKSIEPIGDYISISCFNNIMPNEFITNVDKIMHLSCRRNGLYITKHFPSRMYSIEMPWSWIAYISAAVLPKSIIVESFHEKDIRSGFLIDNQYIENMIPKEFVVSRVSFVSIEYVHPKLSKPLAIKLSGKYFIEGNDILSDIFVCRYLSQEYGKHVIFPDMDYKLNIIDGNIKFFTLDKNQHLKLSVNEYTVIDNNKMYNSIKNY
jgi:hypothetical protein